MPARTAIKKLRSMALSDRERHGIQLQVFELSKTLTESTTMTFTISSPSGRHRDHRATRLAGEWKAQAS